MDSIHVYSMVSNATCVLYICACMHTSVPRDFFKGMLFGLITIENGGKWPFANTVLRCP